MNTELTTKKRTLFKNNRFQFQEKNYEKTVSVEEFKAKLLECVAKQYEKL